MDYAGRKHHPHPIDANHSDCARFGNAAQHPFDQIASELTGIAAAAISDVEHRPRTSLPSGQLQSLTHENSADSVPTLPMARLSLEPAERGVEPVYFKLTRYNTVFLVDDSSSMEDLYQPELNISSSNWSDTTHALEECAKIILGARGRLKVHFFNDLDRYNDNVSGVSDIRELCRFRPRGDTPTYQRLKRHLDEYLEAFLPLNARQREAYSGLNLIIFTDGAPEGRFDDIEEVIVDAATDLDTTRADKYKVGIQFVQIGNDESVTKFFDRIDNEIKGEHRLRRDVSTIGQKKVEKANVCLRRWWTPLDTISLQQMKAFTERLFLVLSTKTKMVNHLVFLLRNCITIVAMWWRNTRLAPRPQRTTTQVNSPLLEA